MEVAVRDRIALDFLEETERLLGFVGALELDQDGATADTLAEADEFGTVDGELLRGGVLAIENGGNEARFAEAARVVLVGGAPTGIAASGLHRPTGQRAIFAACALIAFAFPPA